MVPCRHDVITRRKNIPMTLGLRYDQMNTGIVPSSGGLDMVGLMFDDPRIENSTYTYIHTYIHTYILTYIHTYIHIYHIYCEKQGENTKFRNPCARSHWVDMKGGKACNANASFDVASCGDSRPLFRASSNQVPSAVEVNARFVAQN